jgi:hypothetical protein
MMPKEFKGSEITSEWRSLIINGKYLKKYKPALQAIKINEE